MRSKVWNIFIPLCGILIMMLLILIFCWKRIFRTRPMIFPYRNPQVALITQAYYQSRPYQTVWMSPPVEQLPPSYYSVTNNTTIPSSVSYAKQ
ncbi:unnamed protein product [Rotaria sp. Silwood2]|nr:unnamed protein product [Rotaria sp. Silwood2]CAF4063883.1 unnamed protein product [Rotaria sp. Silwood2]